MPRRGKYYGLNNICPFCGETPPPAEVTATGKVKNYNRWRWMSAHVALHMDLR